MVIMDARTLEAVILAGLDIGCPPVNGWPLLDAAQASAQKKLLTQGQACLSRFGRVLSSQGFRDTPNKRERCRNGVSRLDIGNDDVCEKPFLQFA
jgi:hypothetical protein